MNIVLIYALNGTKDIHLTSLDVLFHNFIENLIVWHDFISVLEMIPANLLIDLISYKYYLILKNESNVIGNITWRALNNNNKKFVHNNVTEF